MVVLRPKSSMKPLLGLSAVLSQRAAPFRATIKAMNSLEHTAGSD